MIVNDNDSGGGHRNQIMMIMMIIEIIEIIVTG